MSYIVLAYGFKSFMLTAGICCFCKMLLTVKKSDQQDEKPSAEVQFITGSAPQSMPGHTGYLTLATLPPVWSRSVPVEELQVLKTIKTEAMEVGA